MYFLKLIQNTTELWRANQYNKEQLIHADHIPSVKAKQQKMGRGMNRRSREERILNW